jgi:hypothetical protein
MASESDTTAATAAPSAPAPASSGRKRHSFSAERLLGVIALAVLVLAHSQVTLQHWAYRMADVRTGRLSSPPEAVADGQALCRDIFASYRPNALAGTTFHIGERDFAVVSNTVSTVTVAATLADLGEHTRYRTGYRADAGLARLALAVPGINVTPADVMLAVGCLVAVFCIWRRRCWRALLPPAVILGFVALCGVTVVDGLRWLDSYDGAADRGAGLRELVQLAEVLGAGFVVFRLAFRQPAWRLAAAGVLLGMAVITGLCAAVEYRAAVAAGPTVGFVNAQQVDGLFGFAFNPTRSKTTGSESSRNVLAMYLALIMPLAVALLLGPGVSRRWRLLGGAAAVLAAALTLSLPLLLCGLVGAVSVAMLARCQWRAVLVLVGGVAVVGVTCAVWRHHGLLLLDSVALYRQHDTYGLLPAPMTGQGLYPTRAEQPVALDWNPWQQKYVEWQAAANAVSYSPLLGHGLGTYQTRINAFYSFSRLAALGVPKSPVNYMERDAHGQFVVQAVETGVLGVLGLVAVLLVLLHSALRARERCADDLQRALLAGAAGSLVVLLVSGLFGAFLIRGVQFVAVALMALAAGNMDEDAAPDAVPAVPPAEGAAADQ